jgi:enamine deaminase RidA (YjgF/YER057c/UK114 family)
MRVDLEDRSILYVSGTASIGDRGQVVHPGHIEGQVERMLENIKALLAGQNAGFADVVCATTYLKDPGYAPAFRRIAGRRGFPAHVPNTVCVADICRPEWLCEMEITAVLP